MIRSSAIRAIAAALPRQGGLDEFPQWLAVLAHREGRAGRRLEIARGRVELEVAGFAVPRPLHTTRPAPAVEYRFASLGERGGQAQRSLGRDAPAASEYLLHRVMIGLSGFPVTAAMAASSGML